MDSIHSDLFSELSPLLPRPKRPRLNCHPTLSIHRVPAIRGSSWSPEIGGLAHQPEQLQKGILKRCCREQ